MSPSAWDPSRTHWGRAGVAFVSKARGQQTSVTCVHSVPAVVSQRGEANNSAECWGLDLGNLPEAISTWQWNGSCSTFHSALGSCSPWAAGKGQQGVKPLLSKQIFPSSGDSLKRKFLPDLSLLQMSSRLDEIFLGFGYLFVLWKASVKIRQQVQYLKMFLLCKCLYILRYSGHSEREIF